MRIHLQPLVLFLLDYIWTDGYDNANDLRAVDWLIIANRHNRESKHSNEQENSRIHFEEGVCNGLQRWYGGKLVRNLAGFALRSGSGRDDKYKIMF